MLTVNLRFAYGKVGVSLPSVCERNHPNLLIVAQELRILLDKNYKEKQFYWVRDKKGTNAEIDFVWQTPTQIIPIEVKAGTNSHLRSLHSYVNAASHHVTAVRFWSGELSIQDVTTPAPDNRPYRLINIPFYYIGQLQDILKQAH